LERNVQLYGLDAFGPLNTSERAALLDLAEAPHNFAKGGVIRKQGATCDGFFLLLSGWAAASHILADGGRLILSIHLPGDAIGTSSMVMEHTSEGLVAVTDVVVAKVTLKRFGELFITHPRLAARFMLSMQQERVMLMDRLVAIGRTSAEACMARLLLDLKDRLAALNMVKADSFETPLTQDQIADLLGLTPVHVNRVLASLKGKGLIRREGRRVTIVDVRALALLSFRPQRQQAKDQSWLPRAN